MEMNRMIKKIAWDTFKNTGDINAFLEFKQIENAEKGIEIVENNIEFDKNDIENIQNQNIKKDIL